MHFALTEEQAAIQETALTFAKERFAPHAIEWDEKSFFPVDGIMGALAYGCPSITGYVSIHNMVAWMVGKYASEAQIAEWMPKLVSMQWLSAYCLTEPGSGSDAAALKPTAKRTGETY